MISCKVSKDTEGLRTVLLASLKPQIQGTCSWVGIGLVRCLPRSGLPWWEDSPGGSDSKESVCNAGDLGLIPRSGRSPGEGSGYPLQYSCLENLME